MLFLFALFLHYTTLLNVVIGTIMLFISLKVMIETIFVTFGMWQNNNTNKNLTRNPYLL